MQSTEGELLPIRADIVEFVLWDTTHAVKWRAESLSEHLDGVESSLVKQIEDLPWIEDGMTNAEFTAARALSHVAKAGQLDKLIDEPWVIEGWNLEGLKNLENSPTEGTRILDWVFASPIAKDGVSYRESKIVAVLNTGPGTDASLLDPGSPHTLEERTIRLPLAGEIELNIIRARPGLGYAGMMDDLEEGVRSLEAFIGLPFPQRQVIYWISWGDKAAYVDTNVYIGHEVADRRVVWHEAAHYYWNYRTVWFGPGENFEWIDEGAADFLSYGADATRDIWAGLSRERRELCMRLTIADIEASDMFSGPIADAGCWYPVGEALYRDLYSVMEPINFRLAFRRWFLHTHVYMEEVCPVDGLGPESAYCHVMEAFTTYAAEGTQSEVGSIINRWYGVTD